MCTSATAGRDLFTPFGGQYLCCPLISRGGVFCGMPAFSISLIGLGGSLSFCFWVIILFDNKRIKQIPCGFANIRNKKIKKNPNQLLMDWIGLDFSFLFQ